MGIQNLLQLLKPIQLDKSLEEYKGHRIGVDTYCWLHQGVTSCGKDFLMNRPTDKHIKFCIKKVNELKQFGIEPIMVFDGAPMPSKAGVHIKRAELRAEKRAQALQLLSQGNEKAADKLFARSIGISYEIANQCIQELKAHGIECIVAPFEADAQLAYLQKIGYISAAITLDSDLLVFGCGKVLYKLEWTGRFKEISLENLVKHPKCNFRGWSHDQFVLMCILAGCDYLKNCKNLGIMKAYKLVSRTADIEKLVSRIKYEITAEIPIDFVDQILRAFLSFKYHQVYCPLKKCMVHVNELDDAMKTFIVNKLGSIDFLGRHLSDEECEAVANGRVNPLTLQPFIYEDKRKAQQTSMVIETKRILLRQNQDSANKQGTKSKYFIKTRGLPLNPEVCCTSILTLLKNHSTQKPHKIDDDEVSVCSQEIPTGQAQANIWKQFNQVKHNTQELEMAGLKSLEEIYKPEGNTISSKDM